MKSIACFIAILVLPLAASAQAYSGECGTCVDRKQRMCADECESVPVEKSRVCQQHCIAEYCEHKCAKDAPELVAYLKENCDDCLEQQFGACEGHCSVGTPRQKAVCQLDCSTERCTKLCAAGAPAPKPDSAKGTSGQARPPIPDSDDDSETSGE